jgi:hypothetical protein
MKKIKQIIVSLLIAVMIAPNGKVELTFAAEIGTTITAGQITTDTIWTKEGSPYKVTGGFGLADGVTLTIEKGVKVEFSKNTGLSAYYGQLIVNGTESEKVIFQFEPSVDNTLYNERIDLGSNSQLKNIEIHGARIGLDINGQNNLIENALIMDSDFYGIDLTGKNNHIKNSILKNNQNGVNLFGGENRLTGNTIDSSSESGLIIEQNSTKDIFINNIITKSGAYGLQSEAPYDSISSRFYHNTFKENHLGIVTGTANIFHQNNILDKFTIISSTLWNMDLTGNFWGTTDRNEIFGKIKSPGAHYLIYIDPSLTAATGLLERIEAELPVFNSVKDNDEFVTGHANPGDHVTITQKTLDWTSVKEVIADENGLFKAAFKKVPVGEKIEAYTTTPYGIKSPIVFINVTDGTKPLPPVVDEVSNVSSTVKGTGESGTKVIVKKGELVLGESTVKDDGSFEISIPLQQEGASLTVTLTDSSQLKSEPTTVVIKDRIPPNAPIIDPITPMSIKITGTAELGSTVYLLRADRVLLQQTKTADNGTWSFDISQQPLGTEYKFDVVDKNGNRYYDSLVTVGLLAPTIEDYNDSMTLMKGKTEPNSTVWIYVDNQFKGGITSDSTGNIEYLLGQQKAGSVIKLKVFKNGYSSETEEHIDDVTAPLAPQVGQLTEKSTRVVGIAERFSIISIKTNGHELAAGVVNSAQEFHIDIPVQKVGTVLEIQATDSKGNISKVTTSVVQNVAPATPKVNVVTNKATQLTGQAEPNVTIIATIAGTKFIGKAGTNGLFKIMIPIQNAGTTISVVAKESPVFVSNPAVLQITKIGPNMPTVNTISNKTTYVSGKTEAYATVSVIMAGKTYTTRSDAKGNYKVMIPVQNAAVRVLIVAKDSQKINSATRVTNIVRVAPNMPTVNTVRTFSTAITGKTEPFTSVIVKIGSKIYTSKSDKYGNYKVTISKQRKGTKLYVYAKDSIGISAIRTLSVL